MQSEKRYILIDTDPGIDDAQAIILALGNKELVEVVAFTIVTGNCGVHQGVKNLKRLLHVCKESNIPIYKGSPEPLLIDIPSSDFHGKDGFGDFYPDDIDADVSNEIHAAQAMIDYGKKYKGKLELVCIGPLTNVALAYHLDPMFSSYIKHLYIMGGNYLGRGNVTASAEFNFYADVEAAHVVMRAVQIPTTLVCWELCENHQISMDWYYNVWGAVSSETNQFRKNLNESIIKREYKKDSTGYYLCDELLMGVVLWSEEFIKESSELPVRVVLSGEARGMMVCDSRYFTQVEVESGYRKVRIITKIDLELFKTRIIECLKQLP